MNKIVLILIFGLLVSSCATQQKSVELANGEMVTQKQYDRMLEKAFKTADKDARKFVKSKLNRKEVKELRENTTVILDTIN